LLPIAHSRPVPIRPLSHGVPKPWFFLNDFEKKRFAKNVSSRESTRDQKPPTPARRGQVAGAIEWQLDFQSNTLSRVLELVLLNTRARVQNPVIPTDRVEDLPLQLINSASGQDAEIDMIV
jgi:hypothetical protein